MSICSENLKRKLIIHPQIKLSKEEIELFSIDNDENDFDDEFEISNFNENVPEINLGKVEKPQILSLLQKKCKNLNLPL